MSTSFKLIKTQEKEEGHDSILAEPVLASFPNNLPPAEVLNRLNFTLYQQEQNNIKKSQKRKKRAIKAERKGIRYIAKNFSNETNPKDQASEYYLGVFNTDENKVYMISVSAAYQFTQEIDNFKEIYGQDEDNEQMKSLSYMDQKLQLVNAFGTRKAQKKVTSMLTNMVDENGITSQTNKGIRDHRLTEIAQHIEEEQVQFKLDQQTKSNRSQNVYSKEAMLPQEMLREIPYKQTLEALQQEDQESLSKLINSYLVKDMLNCYYQRYYNENSQDKQKLKASLKQHIYLDALITFYRWGQQIEESPEELSRRFKLPVSIVDRILYQFTQISLKNQSRINNEEDQNNNHQYKYVKSKENVKKLICYILGISVLLHAEKQMQASILAKILKKEVSDLKSFFQELGFHYTVVKENGQDDLIVSKPDAATNSKKEQPQKQEKRTPKKKVEDPETNK